MSRWLPTAALLAALVLLALVGCGPSATTTGKGARRQRPGSSAGKAPDTGKDGATGAGHHDPG